MGILKISFALITWCYRASVCLFTLCRTCPWDGTSLSSAADALEESCWHEWLKIEACLQGWFCIISCSAPIIKAVNLISSTLHNSLLPLQGLVCVQFCTASACAGNIFIPGRLHSHEYHLNCHESRAPFSSTQTLRRAFWRAHPWIIWLLLLKPYRQKYRSLLKHQQNWMMPLLLLIERVLLHWLQACVCS